MDIFTQNKWLKWAVGTLIALNLTIIALGTWKEAHPLPPPPIDDRENVERVNDLLKNELNLTNAQAEQLASIRANFFEKLMRIEAPMRQKRDSMAFILFKENIDTLLFYDLAQRAAADAYQTEIIHLEQAQQFKRIFTPEQMEKFHKIIKEIRRSFKPERRERPNH